jgi:hypothetical protein
VRVKSSALFCKPRANVSTGTLTIGCDNVKGCCVAVRAVRRRSSENVCSKCNPLGYMHLDIVHRARSDRLHHPARPTRGHYVTAGRACWAHNVAVDVVEGGLDTLAAPLRRICNRRKRFSDGVGVSFTFV